MIKRIYVDNFRCLVNFELRLDRLNLMLGDNGVGKTTVFDVIHRLRQFICGKEKVNTLFPARDLTRWQDSNIQRFELDFLIDKNLYSYTLQMEHDVDKRLMRVKQERLLYGTKPLPKVFGLNATMVARFVSAFSPNP